MCTGEMKIRHSSLISFAEVPVEVEQTFCQQTPLLTVPMVDVLGEPEDVSFQF